MRKPKLYIIWITLIIMSCERTDFGDTNTDPYAPSSGNADALFRAAIVNYYSFSGWRRTLVPSLYCQYQSQPLYTEEQRYSEYAESWSNDFQSLTNFKEVLNITEDIRGDTSNRQATAELISVLIWKGLTDAFGDIPYADALQGENSPNPAYSTQEAIYFDLIARAKAARDLFSEEAFKLDADTDMIYEGNIIAWRKFANTLIMGLAIQISNRYPDPSGEAATAFVEALNNSYGSMEYIEDSAVLGYDLEGGVKNPFSGTITAFFALSKEFTDAVQGEIGRGSLNPTSNHTWDNRINRFSTNPAEDGLPYGYATYEETGEEARMALDLVAPDAESVIYSATYSLLNRADAAQLGWTNENPESLLRQAIISSYNYWNVEGAIAYADARITDAEDIGYAQVIGEEKWVALFPYGVEAWTEQRRTGYPLLLPSPEPLNDGTIPTRYVYPTEESSINSTNWAKGVATLNPPTDNNSSKIWWDD